MKGRLRAAAIALLLLPLPVSAQDGGWNSPRALELVERARRERARGRTVPPPPPALADSALPAEARPATDSLLRSYAADARGRVYFYVDRADTDERVLVRTDQVALEIFWQAPSRGRQRIVGRRDRMDLPTTIRYHMDHLTVVQDDFGDRIRLGDGDEVEAVVHPAAAGATEVYDFRLADSLTLRLPPAGEVRVYEVEVRPQDPGAPGYVGSLFLARSTGAIVRMAFTFTPSSYVDPYLDHIRIRLDNALWEGRWWLPHRQEVELRREIPQLDVPAATVIRGRWEIRDYEMNVEIPERILYGPRVTWAHEEALESFPFEEGIHEELEEDGLAPSPELEEIRARALEAVGERYLSGRGSGLRLFVPSVSETVRYGRAEGWAVGLGLSWSPSPPWRVRLHGGWAFGRDEARARAEATWRPTRSSGLELGLEAYAGGLRDVGPLAGASGTVNTLAALLADEDYADPWFATGGAVRVGRNAGPLRLSATLRHESHESAELVVGDGAGAWRPVLPAEDGYLTRLELRARRPSPAAGGWEAELALAGASFEGRGYPDLEVFAGWRGGTVASGASPGVDVRADLRGGWTGEGAPAQAHVLLGGRGTVPGHPYRTLAGDRWWLLRAEASRPLLPPWLTGRVQAASGGTALEGAPPPAPWPTRTGSLHSVGAGIGVGWDVLHLDVWRGVDGGRWEWVLSVDRRFRGLL